jgi:hypothetical protein
MFAVGDIYETLGRLFSHGTKLFGEAIHYRDSCRLCYIHRLEGFFRGLAQELT